MNVLAIGAHPDDIEFSCAGTLALYTAGGARVVHCVVTDGRAHPQGEPDQVASLRRIEAEQAAGLIGAELLWLGIPDGQLMADLPTRLLVMDAIRAADPDIILTHPPEDYHTDHVATSRLVMEAAQMAFMPNHPSRLPALPFRNVPVAFFPSALGINFNPEDYVDISPVFETKQNMLLQHRSQYLPEQPFAAEQVGEDLDRYYILKAMRVVAEFYGLACSVPYAEAFRWWRASDRLVARRLLP